MKPAEWFFRKLFFNSRKSFLEKLKSFQFCEQVQKKTLLGLIQKARQTQFGIHHDFSQIRSISTYQKKVSVRTYENFLDEYFKPATKKIDASYDSAKTSPFLENITWPGLVPFYGLSSGTTSGSTKFIPLTSELLHANQKASLDLVAFHFLKNPATKILDAKTFFLGATQRFVRNGMGELRAEI